MIIKRIKRIFSEYIIIAALAFIAFAAIGAAGVFPPNCSVAASEPSFPVIPGGFEQLYELSAPVDVDFNGDDMLILEYDKADKSKNRLSILRGGVYRSYDFSSYDATEAKFFRDGIIFLSGSKLYIFNEEDGTATETNMVAATAFSVYGNVILTNNSGGLFVYRAEDNFDSTAFTKIRSLSLGDSPEALVLADETSAYYFFNDDICYFALNDEDRRTLKVYGGDVRYVVYNDGRLYYSTKSGVMFFDTTALYGDRVNSTPSDYNVQGLAFKGDRLLAAYKGKKAIKEIDLTANDPNGENFTLYAITAESSTADRVSPFATDLAVYGDALYIVDGKTLKTARPVAGEYREYELSFIAETSSVSAIASNGRSVALVETLSSDDTKIIITELTEDGAEVVREYEEYKSVTSITENEGDYYFINNTTNVNKQFAEIDRVKSDGYDVEYVTRVLGVGWKIYIDVFGETYLALERDGSPCLFSTRRDEICSTPTIAKDVFADFDGNVYYTLSDGKLYRYDGEATATYEFALWANAPAGSKLSAVELVPQTDEVYLLYNGFVLRAEGLGISTPQKITPPADYGSFSPEEIRSVALSEGSMLFRISPELAEGAEYFDYIDYSTKTGDGKYVLLKEFSRYSLIADENGTYVVRLGSYDEIADFDSAPIEKELLVTNDVHAYCLPVLDDYYRSFSLKTNESVKVVSETVFNGASFSLVEKDGEKGYIPSAFLKNGIADVTSPITYRTATVGKRGAAVYSSADASEIIGTLSYGDVVYVVSEENGMSEIVFDGGRGYVRSDSFSSFTHYAVRNLIVLLLLFIALFASVIYIFRSRVFGKKDA